jgi:hypothetical protein
MRSCGSAGVMDRPLPGITNGFQQPLWLSQSKYRRTAQGSRHCASMARIAVTTARGWSTIR